MATDKNLPDWAVVGAEVLLKGYGDSDLYKRTIERVTKTSAFLSDKSRFVATGWGKDRDYLEEYGSGQRGWRSGRSIQPIAGERAQYMIQRKQRLQNERDFEALINATVKAHSSRDPETELGAVTDLIAGAVVRKAQLEVLVEEQGKRERERRREAAEFERLRKERIERESQL